MSSRNDEADGAGIALAMIGAVAILILGFLFALIAFIALILTVLALCAWTKPLSLGSVEIVPSEARAFVVRGIAGALIVPAFVLFSSVLFDFHVREDFWRYFVIGGYSVGSVVIGFMLEKAREQEADAEGYAPPPTYIPPPAPVHRAERSQAFEFASWDDDGAER